MMIGVYPAASVVSEDTNDKRATMKVRYLESTDGSILLAAKSELAGDLPRNRT
jgi:hypothetical protein